MSHRVRLAVAAIVGIGLLAASPAAAQTYSDGYKFLQAIEKQDQDTVEKLLSKNATVIDSRDIADGHTALHTVIKKRAYRWLSYLLGKGANPNIADKDGVTPLMLASQMGLTDAVSALAQSGAKVDTSNDAGETPLIAAVHKHDLAMVRVLLIAGADPLRADNSGRSARDYAVLDGADNPVLAEIDKRAKDQAQRKKPQVYGPTF